MAGAEARRGDGLHQGNSSLSPRDLRPCGRAQETPWSTACSRAWQHPSSGALRVPCANLERGSGACCPGLRAAWLALPGPGGPVYSAQMREDVCGGTSRTADHPATLARGGRRRGGGGLRGVVPAEVRYDARGLVVPGVLCRLWWRHACVPGSPSDTHQICFFFVAGSVSDGHGQTEPARHNLGSWSIALTSLSRLNLVEC